MHPQTHFLTLTHTDNTSEEDPNNNPHTQYLWREKDRERERE